MNVGEKTIVIVAGAVLTTAIGIGLIVTTVSSMHNNKTASRPTPVTQTQTVGNVSVTIADRELPLPDVLTTEQLADELECNADTVRRRHIEGRLHGYEKADRNSWIRVAHDSAAFRALRVHGADSDI